MGCSVSVHGVVQTSAIHENNKAALSADSYLTEILQTKKWRLLMDWCGWHARDQFGFEQPTVDQIIGIKEGRSILGGVERPHEYQVAVSFPGATFVKGELGTYTNLTDADGNIIATNGAEMAEAIRHWLVEDWLEGDERRGLTHVFIDKCNLLYCDGSVLAEGFGKKDAKTAVAVLNENWAIYLREAFLEARCVVFLINQDWMDSVPCNLEFEGLVRKKRGYRTDGAKQAVIFVDITRSTYSTASLPLYLAAMREVASRYFDVHSFTYNEDMGPEEKRAVRRGLGSLVNKYCIEHDLPAGFELKVKAERRLNWSNWIYYGCLEGTNGWRTLAEAEGLDWKALEVQGGDAMRGDHIYATFAVREPFPSRRFRMRVTRLYDGMFGSLHVTTVALYDRDTGENIVDYGKGYIKARGEYAGVHPATGALERAVNKWVDRCGNRQYSWLEWLVPDDRPPVTVGKVAVAVHRAEGDIHSRPVDLVFEARTLESWPRNGTWVQDKGYVMPWGTECEYDFHPEQKDPTPPRWVRLHAVQGAHLQPNGGDTFEVPADRAKLACSAFRLRFTDVLGADTARTLHLPRLELSVSYPAPGGQPLLASTAATAAAALYPVGGGTVSGSGGQETLEDSGPAYAFTDHQESRWIDLQGGGIDGTAWWQYDHPVPITLVEYGIRSSINSMGFYDQLHGSPRDWVLKARLDDRVGTSSSGGTDGSSCWEVVDTQESVYFADVRQLKRFSLSKPVTSRSFRLEFSAVRCGCASSALMVGDIYLLARRDAAQAQLRRPLLQHQTWVTPSAHVLQPHPRDTASWASPSALRLRIPLFPRSYSLAAMTGGTMRWQGKTEPWYDTPMQFPLSPVPAAADEAAELGRPGEVTSGEVAASRRGQVWTGTMTLVGRPQPRRPFRMEYPDGEVVLSYSADRPLVLAAYSLTAQSRYQRGDLRSWRLEAQTQDDSGAWCAIHSIEDFVYEKMCQTLMLHLPDNQRVAKEYRIVITRLHSPSPHIATTVALYKRVPPLAVEVAAAEDENAQQRLAPSQQRGAQQGSTAMLCEPLELASLEVSLRPREGKCILGAYTMVAEAGLPAGTPTSWVVEGLTSQVGG